MNMKNQEILSFFDRYKTQSTSVSKVKEKRCVIYNRVSSAEQLLNDSLKTQNNTNTAFAVKKGFTIVDVFGDSAESAKTDEDRKEFVRMLDFVFDAKNDIDAIIVFNYDRFSRSGLGGIEIVSQLMKNDVKVYSAINGLDPDSLEGKLMLVITLLQANIQNVNKSIDTKRKMEAKLRDGVWCHMLCLGYFREEKTKEIKVNEEGRLIQEGMKLFLNGYTITQVQQKMFSKGLSATVKKWGEILRNPFYCGVMVSVTLNNEPVLGTHEAIITQKEFQIIQEKLDHNKSTSLIDEDAVNGLALKGLVRCSKCSKKYSGYLNKKKNLYYYICSNRECRSNVSAKIMNHEFKDYLKGLIPKEVCRTVWKENLSLFMKEVIALNNQDLEETEKEFQKVKNKINVLADKLLEGVLTNEIFNDKLEELDAQKKEISKKLELIENVSSNPSDITNTLYEIVSKSASIYSNGAFYQRREMIENVFQSNFFYDKDNRSFRTFSNSKIIELTRRLSGSYNDMEGIKKAESLKDSAFG